jgi:hypothetical protein
MEMTSAIPSLVSGAIGGLISGIGAKLTWDWYKKPDLEFNQGVISNKQKNMEELTSYGEYQVEVSNSGRSVATNCKARIKLEGTKEGKQRKLNRNSESDEKYIEKPTTYRYSIDLEPNWNEDPSASRIDINRDGKSSFRLFEIRSEAVGYNTDFRIRFGERDIETWEEGGSLWKTEPIRVEVVDADIPQSANNKATLSREEFEEIEWHINKVIVTSANASKIEGEIKFDWSGKPIPDVKLKQ